ncbi:MAG: hypothetical protein WBJ33_01450 [Candidatus Nanopelagicales bacterium]
MFLILLLWVGAIAGVVLKKRWATPLGLTTIAITAVFAAFTA